MESRTAQWLDSITTSVRATTLNLGPRKAAADRLLTTLQESSFDFSLEHEETKSAHGQTTSLLLSVQSLQATITRQLEDAFKRCFNQLQTAGVRVTVLEGKSSSVSLDQHLPALSSLSEEALSACVSRPAFEAAVANLKSQFEQDNQQLKLSAELTDPQSAELLRDLHRVTTSIDSTPSRTVLSRLAKDIPESMSEQVVSANFPSTIRDFHTDTAAAINRKSKQCSDEIAAFLKIGNESLWGHIDDLASKASGLRSLIAAERARGSTGDIEDSLSNVHLENIARLVTRLRSRVEARLSNKATPRFRDLKDRVQDAEKALREKEETRKTMEEKRKALEKRLEAIMLRQDTITDDSGIVLSVGDAQASVLETNSDFVLISMHDVGDSDLESQGYISPLLSPTIASLQPFRFSQQASSEFVSPQSSSIIKVEDFAQSVVEDLISTETDTAFRLIESAIGELGVKHSLRGPMSIIPRSTLQYSDINETLEDFSDLEEEEPGETSPTFLLRGALEFVSDPELP